MAALKIVLAVVALSAPTASVIVRREDTTVNLEPQLTGGFLLVLEKNDNKTVFGHIGRTLISPFITKEIDGGVEISIEDAILQLIIIVDAATGARGIQINWNTKTHSRLEDCIDFGTSKWYGGPMQHNQIYPIQNSKYPYKGYVVTGKDNERISERYWLNSAGQYVYVHPQVPLFVNYNDIIPNHICFGAQKSEPYSVKRSHTVLAYDIWFLQDVKSAHKHAVANYLGKPTELVDYKLVKDPIWSVSARFNGDVNSTNIWDFAEEIIDHGFNNSTIEFDGSWETCFGSLTVDTKKFPNLRKLVSDLEKLDIGLTIWVHPFINKDCDPWYTNASNKGYLVVDEEGSSNGTWWYNNGNVSGHIDFTNPDAAEWWYQRVLNLSITHGIDSIQCVAGETDFAPSVPVQPSDFDFHPNSLVSAYVRTCAKFGPKVQVQTGFMTQDLPVFVRMVGRDSTWDLDNGLATIITASLQMNLNGYIFILPDAIGGNGKDWKMDKENLPSKELFIRWVQATALLPAMRFSVTPWSFDDETTQITNEYVNLHATFADYIHESMEASMNNGTPVVAPLWWADPYDEETFSIWDEFLLGESVLVAPVLTENTTSRQIYLPEGTWYDQGNMNKSHVGPAWIEYYAPLDVLPYFVKETAVPDSASVPAIAVILVLLSAVVNLKLV